jgi:hypothetical protein
MTEKRLITPEQYAARLAPALSPTTEELFEHQRGILAENKFAPADLFDGFVKRIPSSGLFLLVPPPPASITKLDWDDLMARVEWNGETGQSYLNPKRLADLTPPLARPAVLLDVEDGRARLNARPTESREAIAYEGRQSYTLWQGYIHALLFPVVLAHHNMDFVGSRYCEDGVPDLFLSDGEPTLDGNWEDGVHPKWGAPSCGSVIAP